MPDSDAFVRGSSEWWNAWSVEHKERQQRLDSLSTSRRKDYPDGRSEYEWIPGGTPAERAELQAEVRIAWKARIKYALAKGEFKPPEQSKRECALYGSGTSLWSRYALIHAAAFWGGILAVGGLAYLIGGKAAGAVASVVVGTAVALFLGKRYLAMLCSVAMVGAAGYVFGPKRYVNQTEHKFTGNIELEPANLSTHWIGVSLALGGLLAITGLVTLIHDRWYGTTSRLRRYIRVVCWLLAVLVGGITLTSEAWLLAAIVFAVCWLLPYGLAALLPITGVAMLESISALPPTVLRRSAYFKDLEENVQWPPGLYTKLSAGAERKLRRAERTMLRR